MKNINTTFFHATLCIVNINMTSLDTCFLIKNNNNNTNTFDNNIDSNKLSEVHLY